MRDTVPSEADLDREFAFTPWRGSCRDPYIAPDGEPRQCRRPRGHDGMHASGYASHRELWEDAPKRGAGGG
ncbi:MAG: hypothetical protein M3P95_05840 [Actinomycetota bacterium]|nr:hypothetical protein [Actinomycetota bacterium]